MWGQHVTAGEVNSALLDMGTSTGDSSMTKQKPTNAAEEVWTMAVPEYGRKYLKIGRNASYAAAKSGLIPTITIGRTLRALVKVGERKLQEG
jgi:hypothetical protein